MLDPSGTEETVRFGSVLGLWDLGAVLPFLTPGRRLRPPPRRRPHQSRAEQSCFSPSSPTPAADPTRAMRNPLLFRWKKGEGEDSSAAAISFPATGSLDNRGSILPDALNTADALERYAQVSEKLEALIAKDGKDGEIQA